MNQRQEIAWRDGDVPVSLRFDDPFYSLEDGLAETRHVFLGGNGLPDRFAPGFHIAELGFGTGLNFLVALQAFRNAKPGGKLYFTSFEAFPLPLSVLRRALSRMQGVPCDILIGPDYDDETELTPRVRGEDFDLHIVFGDARDMVPDWTGRADAWFLDGFAPARNPELWEPALLASVAEHTVPGGTCATYTAAGAVRRALAEAGFEVSRVPGYGRKRHMTIGAKP